MQGEKYNKLLTIYNAFGDEQLIKGSCILGNSCNIEGNNIEEDIECGIFEKYIDKTHNLILCMGNNYKLISGVLGSPIDFHYIINYFSKIIEDTTKYNNKEYIFDYHKDKRNKYIKYLDYFTIDEIIQHINELWENKNNLLQEQSDDLINFLYLLITDPAILKSY